MAIRTDANIVVLTGVLSGSTEIEKRGRQYVLRFSLRVTMEKKVDTIACECWSQDRSKLDEWVRTVDRRDSIIVFGRVRDVVDSDPSNPMSTHTCKVVAGAMPTMTGAQVDRIAATILGDLRCVSAASETHDVVVKSDNDAIAVVDDDEVEDGDDAELVAVMESVCDDDANVDIETEDVDLPSSMSSASGGTDAVDETDEVGGSDKVDCDIDDGSGLDDEDDDSVGLAWFIGDSFEEGDDL